MSNRYSANVIYICYIPKNEPRNQQDSKNLKCRNKTDQNRSTSLRGDTHITFSFNQTAQRTPTDWMLIIYRIHVDYKTWHVAIWKLLHIKMLWEHHVQIFIGHNTTGHTDVINFINFWYQETQYYKIKTKPWIDLHTICLRLFLYLPLNANLYVIRMSKLN